VLKKEIGHRADYVWWMLRGQPVRTPHLVKSREVLKIAHAYHLQSFIESGTYYGEMIAAVRKHFRSICTIEADARYFALAQSRFGRYQHIRLIHGDSREWIPKLLQKIDTPHLFWLDGGYFIWANKESNPDRLMTEINAILSHHVKKHVILLDDARSLNGMHGTPYLEDFIRSLREKYPERSIAVEHDIVHIMPVGG
jgi:hypothetical protein